MGSARHGYELGFRLGVGGMAVVRYGRRSGVGGFTQSVAIKELHPHLAENKDAVAAFLDEARLAARVVHPNVVPTIDVVQEGDKIWMVMPYVEGLALNQLVKETLRSGGVIEQRIAVAIILDVLAGLGAVHNARDERGTPLGIVHRDVSPQNVLVGVDGTARVVDLGIAKARSRLQETRDGQVKGKLSYMAPEQLGGEASPSADLYSAAVVFWELLSSRRLFDGDNEMELVGRVLDGVSTRPLGPEPIADVVMKALALDPSKRFATVTEMADALTAAAAGDIATRAEVGAWVEDVARDVLASRRQLAAEMTAEAEMTSLGAPAEQSSTMNRITSTVVLPQTVSSPTELRRRRLLAPMGLAAVACAILTSAGIARWRHQRALPEPSADLPIARLESSLLTPVPAPAMSATVATTTLTNADPTPAVISAARPSPARKASPKASPKAPSSVMVTQATATPAATTICDPPFTIDASGVRHYKRECIR